MSMRLSEAIRLGAMATRQGFGAMSLLSDDAPCALGAARLAAGLDMVECDGEMLGRLADRWPILLKEVIAPHENERTTLRQAIWVLNDIHCWTRERIADWVESIEQAEQATPGAQASPEPVATPMVLA